MKNVLSEETLRLISVCGIIETILRLPRNSDDYYLLSTVFENNRQSIIIRRNCKACKKNFEPGGPQCVCEAHYHDYDDCYREDCLFCLLIRSIGFSSSIGFDEIDRIYAEGTEEEKQYVRGIMSAVNIVYELTPDVLIANEVTAVGDTVISIETHENKIYLVYEDKEEDGIFIVVFDVSGGERRQGYRRRIEVLEIKKIESKDTTPSILTSKKEEEIKEEDLLSKEEIEEALVQGKKEHEIFDRNIGTLPGYYK